MEERKEKVIHERQNLYKFIKERREDGEQKPVARLLYAMQLNDQTYKETIDEIIKTITDIDVNTGNEITGYLQARENFVLHMIEGQSEILNQFMHYIYREFNKEKQKDIIWANYLMMTEENPTRMYDQHYVEQIQLIGQPATDIDKNLQSNYQRIWLIYQMFVKAGQNSMNRTDKSKEVKLHMEVQLSNDDLAMFAQKHFLSINDYYSMYLDDIEIDLDTEHVFPYTPLYTQLMEYSEYGQFHGFAD